MTTKRQLEQMVHLRVQSGVGRTLENMALLMTGGVVGATAMYIFDESSGSRRRALARDKAIHLLTEVQWASLRKARHLKNRAIGSVMELRSRVRDEARYPIEDEVLEERVRAQLGHAVSNPGALEVLAEQGHVMVRGPVLAGERERIQTRLNKTRGVQNVDLQVSEHTNTEGVPGLQGESRSDRQKMAI